MCGRYARKADRQRIAETFHVENVPDFTLPDEDYNIAPTTLQPIIRQSGDTGDSKAPMTGGSTAKRPKDLLSIGSNLSNQPRWR